MSAFFNFIAVLPYLFFGFILPVGLCAGVFGIALRRHYCGSAYEAWVVTSGMLVAAIVLTTAFFTSIYYVPDVAGYGIIAAYLAGIGGLIWMWRY